MLDDQMLLRILMDSGELETRTAALFDAAMQAGGRDNITVMLIYAQREG